MSETLYVCLTCDRYRPRHPGTPSAGSLLMEALSVDAEGRAAPGRIRTVECLNGCPHPCNVALRAPGKAPMRLSRLTPLDAKAVLEVTQLYAESRDGFVAAGAIPARLRAKVSQYAMPMQAMNTAGCTTTQ